MNNFRLLIGLAVATLSSGGVCHRPCFAQIITLDEIFSSAEAKSTQLRPFVTAEQVAQRDIDVAKSSRLPDIGASLSVSYIGNGFTTKRDFSDCQKAPIPHLGTGLGVRIEQPLYTGGAIINSIRLAELKSTASRYATDLQRDNIRFTLTGYYLDIYKYSNLRKVVEENIDQARKVLDQMHARYEQGTAIQNDITRYELLVSNLELQLVKIDNTLDILNRNLVVTAGLPEDTEIIPDSTILEKALPKDGVEWWQRQAETNSPSISIARSGVDISRRAESLVKSERLPKIGIQAAWTIDGPILVEVPPINRNLSYWYVGLGVNYSLSSLYKTNKSLAKSRAAVTQSVEQLDAARENVSLAVRGDYIRYLESYQELLTQEKSVELALRNYNTTSTRYNADMALITDMLDAANAKLDAEQRRVNARIDIIYYYYKLLFSSGTI